MDATTIDLLVSLLPSSATPRQTAAAASLHHPGSYLHAQTTEAFVSQYMRPAFGWHAARELATIKAPFPIPMLERDNWVYRAYLMQLDERRYYDKTVAMAYNMHAQQTGDVSMSDKIQAMLLSIKPTTKEPEKLRVQIEDHLRYTSQYLGLPYALVEAYEILFYNIMDRLEDSLYIAHEVYPQTRIVEFDENYFQRSSFRDLVKRVGYNHRDMDLTAYLVGIGDRGYMTDMAARDDREAELTRHFMGNGLILARTNLLNHRSVGLSRTTALIAAARQSGNVAVAHPIARLSDSFTDQVSKLRNATQAGFMHQQRVDAGEAVETIEV